MPLSRRTAHRIETGCWRTLNLPMVCFGGTDGSGVSLSAMAMLYSLDHPCGVRQA